MRKSKRGHKHYDFAFDILVPYIILSFGVDPLNWPSFIEIGEMHVAHLPGAPMDSLLKAYFFRMLQYTVYCLWCDLIYEIPEGKYGIDPRDECKVLRFNSSGLYFLTDTDFIATVALQSLLPYYVA